MGLEGFCKCGMFAGTSANMYGDFAPLPGNHRQEVYVWADPLYLRMGEIPTISGSVLLHFQFDFIPTHPVVGGWEWYEEQKVER